MREDPEQVDGRRTGHLEGWYVDPAYRQRGVGRRLVEIGGAWAAERGAEAMTSDAELGNHLSRRAHGALGFAETAENVFFRREIGSASRPDLAREVAAALAPERGHFVFESGHHGDLWLDLDAALANPARTRPWAAELARRARACEPEVVVGPLTGGAFLAQAVAEALGIPFAWAERRVADGAVDYRVPAPLASSLAGRRVLLVDDAVNAGSAWRETLAELERLDARLAGLGALLVLGEAADELARERGVPLATLARAERSLWTPADCPLCEAGEPLAERMNA
jgi:orotate phosphoribosyltransferase